MNFSVFLILLLFAFGLYSAKGVGESLRRGTLKQDVERAVKKGLCVTLMGLCAMGLFCLTLLFFPLVRWIGFSLLPDVVIDLIRILLNSVFDTKSVYAVINMLVYVALMVAELSLIFSALGFTVVHALSVPYVREWVSTEKDTVKFVQSDAVNAYAPEKIFLTFANLRI